MLRSVLMFLVLALTIPVLASASVVRTTYFTIEPDEGLEAVAKSLGQRADKIHREVTAQLGTLDAEHPLIHVKLLSSQKALSGELNGAAIAEWAAGVAFTNRGLILLRIDSQTQLSYLDVFRHEVSHIALARAVRHRHLPHWFIEGVAVHQAGERLIERWTRASDATLTNSLTPLHSYDRSFPRDGTRADLAYAESTAFVAYLLTKHGWRGIRTIVNRVANEEPFNRAFESIYQATLGQAETQWRRRLETGASWLRILGDSTVLWTAATLLFVLSWWVQRRKTRARLQAMAEQEARLPISETDDEFA